MVDRKYKRNDSVCNKVLEKKIEGRLPTPVLSVERSPVLSSKNDTKILKKNSSCALSSKATCGKETQRLRELRIPETKNRSSFSSPTISSSRKTNMEKQKVQQIKPRLIKDLESGAFKTSQVISSPAPRRPPLPVPKKIKKISSPPQVLQEITPIQTFIDPSQPTARHTKSSVLWKMQSRTPELQSESLKAPASRPSQRMIRNQNSVSRSDPSNKQYVRRSGTQKTSVPRQAVAGKTRIPASIGRSKSLASTKEPSRIRETYFRHEEPIHHIMWEGPDEAFHSSGITCPLCENTLSDMPDEYADEYYDDVEPPVFPSVAVLPCGHSFHAVCLDGITPDENSSDPPCFFCLSCTS